ncbi:MAG: TlpA disulfide reductase family protein [Gemmatimonadota bacterium]
MAGSSAIAQGARPGSRAPAIDLPALDGGRIRLADYRGQPVVVTFWASWCPSCRVEFPALVDAYRRYSAQGLRIFAVNERDQEMREGDIRGFLAEVPVPFPVLIDRWGRSRRQYRLTGLPTTVFIDTAGVIRKVLWGAQPPGELDRAIALILADPPAPRE